MRKLVFILIAFIAVVTFIRAFDMGDVPASVQELHAAGAVSSTELNN